MADRRLQFRKGERSRWGQPLSPSFSPLPSVQKHFVCLLRRTSSRYSTTLPTTLPPSPSLTFPTPSLAKVQHGSQGWISRSESRSRPSHPPWIGSTVACTPRLSHPALHPPLVPRNHLVLAAPPSEFSQPSRARQRNSSQLTVFLKPSPWYRLDLPPPKEKVVLVVPSSLPTS